jgi:2',3'-cyclic-nucleotide 2'-phosphodiesterase (5'-nucleotidase family)
LVDAGNVTAGGRAWELLEFEYLLRGYELMGYDAVNIGRLEAGVTAESLRALRQQFPFLISANVLSDDGQALFDPWRIVETTGGYQVGIIGIVDDQLPPDEVGAGVRIAPPAETLSRMLPDLRKQVDFVVLLAFANEDTMRMLAERFYEIDVIVGGDVPQPATGPHQVNKALVTYITDKGKSIGRLDLAFIDGEKVVESSDITMLLEDTPDETMAALVAELRRRQIENNYPTEKEDEEGLTRISGGA